MSGWTRALRGEAMTTKAAAASASPTTAASDDDSALFLGQRFSPQLSARMQSMLLNIANAKGEGGMDAQTALLDLLRESMEGGAGDDAAAKQLESSSDSSRPSQSLLLALASFSHALHFTRSTAMLEDEYARLLDALGFDLADVLLPSLWLDWRRAARVASAAHAELLGKTSAASQRPVSSAALALLCHLMAELAAHAAPRDLTLALRAFHEAHLALPNSHDDEEAEGSEEEMGEHDEEQKHESRRSASAEEEGVSSFQRLSLALPLLEWLTTLIKRTAQAGAKSTSAAASSSSSSSVAAAPSTPLAPTPRQIELYTQTLSVCEQLVSDVGSELRARLTDSSLTAAAAEEADGWVTLHERVLCACIEALRPVLSQLASLRLVEPSLDPASLPSPPSIPPPVPPALSLRRDLQRLLYSSLHATQSMMGLRPSAAREVQEVWQASSGADEAIEAQRTEKQAQQAAGAPDRSLRHKEGQAAVMRACLSAPLPDAAAAWVRSFLALLDALGTLHASDSGSVASTAAFDPLTELGAWFHERRALEAALEEEQLMAWEGLDDEEEDLEGESSGSREDDERSDGEGASPSPSPSAPRIPPSRLRMLRAALHQAPTHSVQGVGVFVALDLQLHYFHHIKPQRLGVQSDASVWPAGSAGRVLSGYRSCLADRLQNAPISALDDAAPFLCALLLQSLRSGELSFLSLALGTLTSLWGCISPESLLLPQGDDDREQDELMRRSGAWMLSETLLQTLVLLPHQWAALRPAVMHAWKSLLISLSPASRARLLQRAVLSCSVPSVTALLLARLKDEVAREWDDLSAIAQPRLLTDDLLPWLHALLVQAEGQREEEEQEEEGENESQHPRLAENVDVLLALLNLWTFLYLRAQADATRAGSSVQQPQPGDRLSLRSAAVRRLWRDKWSGTAAKAEAELQNIQQQIEAAEVAGQQQVAMQLATTRNQMQLAVDLCQRLLQHMQQ